MDPFSKFLGVAMLILLMILILYVIFGQVTVRKLRINPATKDVLGFQYVSGTDIANVIKILSISRAKAERLSEGKMSFLYANVGLIYKNTNQIDRIFAKLLYWLMVFWALGTGVLMLVYFAGGFH
ncbi:MAG: hypothetical protein GY820_20470 [Gammaproteobacteria bacterium]|nr:hypothetical protein [Gammaproteobacteria bacterium]